ncbi:MAG: flagellar hook-length control protein FliK [Oscillospiraceae bacterium]
MAVSLNTSTSRSDFMISDAAIPKRMEELEQAEQSNAFADILGGIGVQTVNADSDSADSEAMKLIQAVANGEMTLDDVDMELIPEDVFKRIAELLKLNPEDSDEDTADMQNVAAELAAMFIAQPEVIADDKSAELTELTGAAVETLETVETDAAIVPAELSVQDMSEQIPAEQFAAEQTEAATEAVAEQVIPATEQTAQVAQAPKTEVRQKPEAKQVGESKPNAEMQAAEQQTEIPVQMNEQTEGDSFNQTMQRSETPAQISSEQPEQAEQKLFESAELTVTERKEQPETSQQTEAPVIRAAAVSERVVEKSDELIMLKNAVKRTPTEAGAELIRAEIPVNIPAAEMPEVKPTEVLEQVEVKLTELVQQAKQGVTEYTLTLNPEELGRITVKMTKASDGAVSVSIAAENSRTQRILEENGAMLQSSLRQHGIQLESWQTVNESQQDMHAEDYRGSRGNQYQGEEQHENPETDDGESFSEIIANM